MTFKMSYLRKLLMGLLILLGERELDPIVRKKADDSYDFIVVGSGPGGATVASRLSEMPDAKILLLEAGESDLKDSRIKVTTRARELAKTDIDWKYETEKVSRYPFVDRTFSIPRGKTLGGSSSINYGAYIRGSPLDFDSWEDSGAAGWGWNNVEPYFRKVENATMEGMSAKLGKNGNLKLSRNHIKPSKAWNLFTEAAAEIGIKPTNNIDDMEGISPMTFTSYKGIRQNSVTAYIRPIQYQRKDRLHIVTGALVSKISIDTKSESVARAYGVEYLKNGKYHTVQANKEVIISAGVIGTPQILLLSGIGPQEDLQNLGIPVIKNLPGVGSNLQDHWFNPVDFMTNLTNPPPVGNPMMQYILNGTGLMGMDQHVTTIFRKTRLSGTPTSLSSRRRPFPEIQLYLRERPALPSISIFAQLLHPKSKGTIKLSSRDIRDHPVIDANFFGHEDDVRVLTEGFRLIEKFEKSSFFQKAGAKMVMPANCNGSIYGNPPRSDKFYNCLIWERSGTGFHPCCTAKMGLRSDKYSVVDSHLRVIGIKGLRVVDASVFPHQISSNTQATVYMIGEKAADMIKETWQTSKV
uniref:L-sorbose 1-dehydrogenase-like isoform X1 n=1 Tax=Styela clava TaxID=7725 RepID=UPI00193AD83B|nr:L-sorbose 1-dehydrogenase-like isoform X1 [Styela clava]